MTDGAAPTAPLVRLDSLDPARGARSFRFEGLVRVLRADRVDEVVPLLERVEDEVEQGRHAAGFVAYESAPAFDAALATHPPDPRLPLAWFSVWERRVERRAAPRSSMDAESDPASSTESGTSEDGNVIADVSRGAGAPTPGPSPNAGGGENLRGDVRADAAPADHESGSSSDLADTVPDDGGAEDDLLGEWAAGMSEEEHRAAVERVRELIAAGDTYQVNLTFPLRAAFAGDDGALHARLCRAQRAAFHALMRLDDRLSIVSASPELFFRWDRGTRELTLRPMKGTAPRGRWPEEDRRRAETLRTSPKERAENLMIVDLLRNDAGRVAVPGSVDVPRLFDVEAYPTVHQMTSTIRARTREGTTLADLFRALFPCGSVTGAPKVRTTEVIRDLEGGPRGVYCGALGFVSPDAAAFSVPIRTLLLDRAAGTAAMGVGSGITWDSAAPAEYAECLDKTAFVRRAPPRFRLLETLLWQPGYGWALLDGHLARLAASAERWDFRCDDDAVRRALDEAVVRALGHDVASSPAPSPSDDDDPAAASSRWFSPPPELGEGPGVGAPDGRGDVRRSASADAEPAARRGNESPGSERRSPSGPATVDGTAADATPPVEAPDLSLPRTRGRAGEGVVSDRGEADPTSTSGDDGRAAGPLRVRLLLAADGTIDVEAHPLTSLPDPARVSFAEEPVDSSDPRLFHKTTARETYDRRRASRPDRDDVLLVDERGEVTEGTVANLVVRLDGELWTPPVESGLLPGVLRAELLRRGVVRERVLTPDDVRRAEAAWLVSSVRGWRRVELLP